MIDPNILNVLKSKLDDPSYSVIIQGFDQPTFCNREELQMIVHQVNPNVFDIINKKDTIIQTLKQLLIDNNIEIPNQYDLSINNIVQKTFTIDSMLNYDQANDMFTSGLSGRISAESNQNIPSQLVQGEIKNKRILFTTKDYPNEFDHNCFTVNKNQLIIDVDDKIQDIKVIITHNNITASYETYSVIIDFIPYITNTVVDGQIIINIEDIQNTIMPTETIQGLDDQINDRDTMINELRTILNEDSEEEINEEEIEAQITTLQEEQNIINNRKQAILNKIQGLNFSSSNPFNIEIKYTYADDIVNSFIESINFELCPEIYIDFINKYNNLPGILLTIDEKNKKYTSYDTTFKKNDLGQYIGVTITFNNLKRLREPVEVNAIIIGDNIVETNDS